MRVAERGVFGVLLALAACGGGPTPVQVTDSGVDAGSDGGAVDAGGPDALTVDAAMDDTVTPDVPAVDAPAVDASVQDAPVGDDASACAITAGAECNALCATGAAPVTTAVHRGEATPTPAGGSLADGDYVLTAYDVYVTVDGGAPPSSDTNLVASEIVVQAGRVQEYTRNARGTAVRIAGTLSTSGATLTITPDCPTGVGAASSPFTADGTHLTAFAPIGTSTTVGTYTRR